MNNDQMGKLGLLLSGVGVDAVSNKGRKELRQIVKTTSQWIKTQFIVLSSEL